MAADFSNLELAAGRRDLPIRRGEVVVDIAEERAANAKENELSVAADRTGDVDNSKEGVIIFKKDTTNMDLSIGDTNEVNMNGKEDGINVNGHEEKKLENFNYKVEKCIVKDNLNKDWTLEVSQ